MIEFDDIKLVLAELKPKIEFLKIALKISERKKELKILEEKINDLNFWQDRKKSSNILENLKNIKCVLENFNKLENEFNETLEFINICDSENDVTFLNDIKNSTIKIKSDIQSQMLLGLLNGKNDQNDAIITIHSGAGGTEAQDWTQMLFRMYNRWAEKHKFKIKVLDFLDGEEAGFKNISILIEGENTYGMLKGEVGVHRLVRISPFDSSGRRHTSFAAVEVIPKIDDKIKIDIPSSEIKIDVFRASGAGGQHVNKTSSAVRITHIISGIVVTCQNERSQIQNKEMAMKTLKSKLFEIKERERLDNIKDIKGIQKEIAWGSQIRSYVFMPYTLVKDHRTNAEIGNVQSVMDGDIDLFIDSYLKYII